MEKSLYKINQDALDLITEIIENGGEITPELEQGIIIAKAEMQTKAIDYNYAIRKIESECVYADLEIKRLQQAKKSREKTIDRLKDAVKESMLLHDITEIKSDLIKINFRKYESVVIDEPENIDAKFITIKQTETIRKADIKKALKDGEVVSGARLEVKQNIQFK